MVRLCIYMKKELLSQKGDFQDGSPWFSGGDDPR